MDEETSSIDGDSQQIFFPSTDEFGGYSSRLRLQSCQLGNDESNHTSQLSTCPASQTDNSILEFNLCDLLGIDIEAKALKIAMADQKRESSL